MRLLNPPRRPGYAAPVNPRLLLALALLGTPAQADKTTPLLQDDLQHNRRTKIDGQDDMGLDSLVGGGGFSTKPLDGVEDRLRAELGRNRPRATPRIVLFLYPGRVDVEKLRAMSEINVDIQLVM